MIAPDVAQVIPTDVLLPIGPPGGEITGVATVGVAVGVGVGVGVPLGVGVAVGVGVGLGVGVGEPVVRS